MGRISSSERASLGSNRFQLPQERQHENLNNQAQVVQTLDSAIQWIVQLVSLITSTLKSLVIRAI